MVNTSPLKTPSKAGRSAAQNRRSASKALKSESSPVKTPTRAAAKTPTRASSKKTPREHNFTSRPPTEEERSGNGRVSGRSLIVWGRPRMADKLLLHIHYECARHKIELPWNSIAHRLHPGSTGAAVNQHLGRLRRELVAEGHLVPPTLPRPGGAPTSSDIRGYIRKDEDGDDKLATRAVYYNERVDDRKFNLPDSLEVRDQINLDCDAGEEGDESDDEIPDSPTPHRRTTETENPEPTNSIEIDEESDTATAEAENVSAEDHEMEVDALEAGQEDTDGVPCSQDDFSPQDIYTSAEESFISTEARRTEDGDALLPSTPGQSQYVAAMSEVAPYNNGNNFVPSNFGSSFDPSPERLLQTGIAHDFEEPMARVQIADAMSNYGDEDHLGETVDTQSDFS
ncbi:hypothetical protein AK830_g9345 [Neonectria ditissima]|uniref:Uncharacterized protein n=1 Tax=Neonectria ditissima TaxID=78410 RepID=A0A0P7BA09_9HYPO|nr:hypothetical protein AK830_g9345 [Neonectria ditissima]